MDFNKICYPNGKLCVLFIYAVFFYLVVLERWEKRLWLWDFDLFSFWKDGVLLKECMHVHKRSSYYDSSYWMYLLAIFRIWNAATLYTLFKCFIYMKIFTIWAWRILNCIRLSKLINDCRWWRMLSVWQSLWPLNCWYMCCLWCKILKYWCCQLR